MTKTELLNYFDFVSEQEKEDCQFYLDVKSVELHLEIMNYLNFKFEENKKLKWSKVSNVLRTDKCIRDKLYIYLSALEEYIRSFISNKYCDNKEQSFWINGALGKRNKIKNNLEKGKNLFSVLQDVDFKTLINQVKKLPNIDKKELFGNYYYKKNLDAVVELRNAVSHHKLLLTYNLKTCKIDGISNNSLKFNVINLKNLLPLRYRYGANGKGGIVKDMKKCGMII